MQPYSYDATVTLGASMQRTALMLPQRTPLTSNCTPQLPKFRVRAAGGDVPSLNVAILRRSVHTQKMLRSELRSILAESGHPQCAFSSSIPSKQRLDKVAPNRWSETRGNGALVAVDSSSMPKPDDSEQAINGHDGRPPTASSNVRTMLTALVRRSIPPQAGPSPSVLAAAGSGVLVAGDDVGHKDVGRTFVPFCASDRFVDVRPPSRGGVTMFREKLHRDLDISLPQALLDGDANYATTSLFGGNGYQPTAFPDNLLIPCPSRYPEAVHSPGGVQEIVKEVGSIRQPPPTAHVRDLQRQSQVESPGRCNPKELQRFHLRPRSVDVLLGSRPRPPSGVAVVNGTPTEATAAARKRVAESRRAFQAQQNVGGGINQPPDAHFDTRRPSIPSDSMQQPPSERGRPASSLR